MLSYGKVFDFLVEQLATLAFHPVFMLLPSFHFSGLQLVVLIQPVQALLLEVNLRLGSGITDLLVLLELKLVQFRVLWYCRHHLKGVVLLGR